MLRVAFLIILSTAGCCGAAAAVSEQAGWREVVRQFAAQHFKNPAWGYSHSVRDYKLAKDLAEADHATLDDDVLFAAAYLHDLAAFAPWDREKEGVDHADEGARVVGAIGVARVMALVDPNGGEPDGPKAVKTLEDNLAQVPSRVLSPAGRKRVPQLQRELAEFLKELRRETNDYRML